jgi:hypothetical protein
MKTVTKLVMGAAAVAASIGAAHAAGPVTQPSTDNSQLLFFVVDTTAHSTYTAYLSQLINGSGGYFNSTDATSGGTIGTLNNVYGDTNFSYNFSTDTALTSFISTAQTAGDTLVWGLLSGAYSGATQLGREPTGNTLFLATGSGSPLGVSESNLTNGAPTSYNTDVGRLNGSTFDSSNGTTRGIFFTSLSNNGTNLNLEGSGFNEAGVSIGTTAYDVYGLTSTGSAGGSALAYLLGSASFNSDILTFTGQTASAVPLPAAAWLFGSGLLGLLGVGRRRDGAASPA